MAGYDRIDEDSFVLNDRDQTRPPWGTRLLGVVVEPPSRRKRRVQQVLTSTVLVTHLLGIACVVGLQWLLLPFDELTSGRYRTAALVVTPLVVLAMVSFGLVWLTWVVRRWLSWPDENRSPTPDEQRLCLAVPFRLTLLTAALWVVGGVVTVIPYGMVDPTVLPVLSVAVVTCGAMACGLGYLVAEISVRPLTAIALKAAPTPMRPFVGIRGRLIGVWVVALGLPMAALVVLAVHTGTADDVSVSRLAMILAFIGVSGFIVSIAAGWLLVTAMLAPILSVRWAMEELAGGNLATRVDVFDGTELGQLQLGFNDMAEMIGERQRLRELFVRHVGSQVARAAELQEPRLGGDTTRVAVLFVDLVGSTTLAATRPASEVVELLNDFFDVVVENVEARGGFIDQFQGDAALAVFGAPVPLADSATSALTAARRLGDALAELLPAYRTGIGVSYGEVVAGYVGSATRFEYTVIGDAVNEAARLCELAKSHPTRVLASGAARDAATPEEAALWRTGAPVGLRGRPEPTVLTWPVDATRV
ncbi:adenylate/guanylate cyclase domain-containing protein [Dietzia alimentaria]|uniref:adenylate/guanylate cyclase domain-containing protein n=1 Tax=Dietzia alimentaria TaxID=665550 RepID=UPI00029AA7C8|nr:adenylate/guanylate cyclase domain-containing protein [Dietzia alimentaria]